MNEMEFGFGVTVMRQRRKVVVDPYSLKTVPGGWDDPEEAVIEGVFVASSSSSSTPDVIRSQVTIRKSLYGDPDMIAEPPKITVADVRIGDRIVSAGHTYKVEASSAADINPFDGSQLVAEIPLTEVLG